MLRIDHLKDRAHIVREITAHETQGEAGLHPTKRSNVEYRILKHILMLIDNYSNEKNKELIEALDGIQDILHNHFDDDPEETPLIRKALNALKNTLTP